MIRAKVNSPILKKAEQAMRDAVWQLIQERKKSGRPLIVWKNGKVVRLSAKKIKWTNRKIS